MHTAEVTQPLASANQEVDAGNVVALYKTLGLVKKLSHSVGEQIKDIIKLEQGPQILLQWSGGPFTLEVEVEEEEMSTQ